MDKLQKKNAGFTLVEVLVAITVLAIVIMPFLHSFVTTANANTRAKQIHRSTVLAQSVMEGFKTEDVESIALQFNYPQQGFRILSTQLVGDGNVAANVEELCFDGAAYTSAIRYENPAWSGLVDSTPRKTASIYSQDMGVSSEFLEDADGKYYFAMTNVRQDNSLYDVLIHLDASEYRDADEYNSTALTEIPVTDLEKDAVCVQKDLYTQNAMAELGVDRSALSRTITITVEHTRMISGNYITKVLAEYAYTAEGITDTYVKTVTCFDNTETGNDLRSVYLYYFPLYPNAAMDDEIKFINNAGIPITFYLLKQKQDSTIMTSTKEDGYNMTLTIREDATADAANMATAIRTNLLTNLASGVDITLLSPRQVTFNGETITNVSELNWGNHLAGAVEDRFFDVDVSIYESGAKAAGFPDSMKYTTFEGSRLD